MAQRETHPYNEFKPGCEKRFTTFYGLVAKSGLKTKNFILFFLQRWGKQKFYPFESRFCFLVQFLSGKSFDKSGQLWQQFIDSKKLRDTWTHPKPPFDTDSLSIESIKISINANREALIELSNLMELDPPPWLNWTYDEIVNDIEKQVIA